MGCLVNIPTLLISPRWITLPIAPACSVEGRRVEHSEDIGAAQDAAFSSGQPMLIDVITDLDTKQPIGFYAGRYPEPF
jgi:thiamine pyrophosphate-dependent acetolactate synthase large subunit-like protein